MTRNGNPVQFLPVRRQIAHKMITQVIRIIVCTMDETRLAAPQKIDTKQIHPRRIHNTAIVTDPPPPVEYRHMKPIVIRIKTRRPQYGTYIAVRDINIQLWRCLHPGRVKPV